MSRLTTAREMLTITRNHTPGAAWWRANAKSLFSAIDDAARDGRVRCELRLTEDYRHYVCTRLRRLGYAARPLPESSISVDWSSPIDPSYDEVDVDFERGGAFAGALI